jgi:hypothetical protein
MDPHTDETGYVPAGAPEPTGTPHRSVFQRRRFKIAGGVGALSLAVALGLQFSTAAHSPAKPTVRVAAARAVGAQNAAFAQELPVDSDDGDTATGGGSSSSGGGIHGAFSLYEGVGGGLEFWFNPDTGQLTIAIGAGVGEGGDGVIGYYTPGNEPEPGLSDFVDASFAAGTIGSVNVSGEYEWESGKFSGSVGATVDGRTLTINSDGTGNFTAAVVGEEGVGFEGSVGAKYTFSFNTADVLKILQDIWDFLTTPDEDDDYYDDYYYDDGESDDVTGDDTTVTDDDGTDDGSSVSDDGSDDAGDGGDSGGDGGGGGGGGGTGCDDGDAEAQSLAAPADEPCDPEPESSHLTVHADNGVTVKITKRSLVAGAH